MSEITTIESPSGLTLYHRGPDKAKGPLPTLFYFALTGEESLTLAPIHVPTLCFDPEQTRIFSMTLPCHGSDQDPAQAMKRWADEMEQGNPILESFLLQALSNLDFLIEQQWIDPEHLAVAGLSRGGFIALHVAARDERIKHVVAYAPLTRLDFLEEFKNRMYLPLIQNLSLDHIIPQLANKKIRFYIGNRDMRVGTVACFGILKRLVEEAYTKGSREPPIEMIISPSIGHKGHGTPEKVFREGMEWVKMERKK
ncbi:MAG: prolyl oligopeptidase family serine peptidase [Chlamydiia bacterium]|nr:prolyl oligopeptidase family serine peptidase [Chlamydiia bacterium]